MNGSRGSRDRLFTLACKAEQRRAALWSLMEQRDQGPTRELSDPDGNICRRGDSLIDDAISRLEEGGGAASPVSSRSMAVAL